MSECVQLVFSNYLLNFAKKEIERNKLEMKLKAKNHFLMALVTTHAAANKKVRKSL